MKIIYLCLLSITLTLFFSPSVSHAGKTPEQLVQEARSQVKEITIQEVRKMMDAKEKMVILGVRDKEEFEQGHISGAMNISRGMLEFLVHDKIPDREAKAAGLIC
jgi:3-mercaptopyruvate sulfurtransferase SseA